MSRFGTAAATLIALVIPAFARATPPDPKPADTSAAPIANYRIGNAQDEIALARTAAPPSISADADVLVLGTHGYETAVKGKNGFVCFVERSWGAGFDNAEFWNPRSRAPNCYNPPAVRSVLPQYMKRTEWVLAGDGIKKMIERTRSSTADGSFKACEPEALAFMMSKQGYLNDEAGGPWLPHVMMFVPHGDAALWAAGLEGSPVVGQDGTAVERTVLFIPVRAWSDGTPAPPVAGPHKHK